MATASPWRSSCAGERFQLVGRPVPVVERARAAVLERISAVRDLAHVQLGAAADHPAHCRAFAGAQRVGPGLEPLEEHAVADQGHLHRFGDARDLVARLQRAQEVGVVEHRERRCEAADRFLTPKALTPFFTPTPESFCASTVVGTRTWRMPRWRRRGDIADQIEKGTAADADDEVVAVDAKFDEPLLQPREERRVVLDLLSAGHDFGMGDKLEAFRMQVGVAGNVVGERRKRGGDVGIDEDDEAVAARRLSSGEGFLEHRVVVREEMLGEAHRIL